MCLPPGTFPKPLNLTSAESLQYFYRPVYFTFVCVSLYAVVALIVCEACASGARCHVFDVCTEERRVPLVCYVSFMIGSVLCVGCIGVGE